MAGCGTKQNNCLSPQMKRSGLAGMVWIGQNGKKTGVKHGGIVT